MTERRIGPKGLALVKQFEGLRLKTYLCPAKVPTIGYGSTGENVHLGMTITEPEAEALLKHDLTRFERCVAQKCPETNPYQFSAMVALAFNIGCRAFEKSSVARLHNLGKHAAAADSFLLWNKGGGRVLPGLVRRRQAERALYLGGSV